MAATYKVLGQVNPAATTATTAYTVPSDTETVISTIAVANTGAYPTTYRIAVRPNGETLATKHYVVFISQSISIWSDRYSICSRCRTYVCYRNSRYYSFCIRRYSICSRCCCCAGIDLTQHFICCSQVRLPSVVVD